MQSTLSMIMRIWHYDISMIDDREMSVSQIKKNFFTVKNSSLTNQLAGTIVW